MFAVRVVGGVKNSYFMTGRVEVRQEATGQDWRTVCADGINQAEANVICREVHYDRAIMLAPSFFGSLTISQVSKYIADIKCKGNETSITDCAITTELEGKCSIAHYNYASVLCVKNSDKDQCKIHFKCILMYINYWIDSILYLITFSCMWNTYNNYFNPTNLSVFL